MICKIKIFLSYLEIFLFRLVLKVPKREIFVTEFIILSHPIWIGDLRNEPKN